MNLARFGFTQTQSAVFSSLLTLEEATGYAVARQAGIARANVYQALDALVLRGLATTRGGRPVIYTASPPRDVLASLGSESERDLANLARDLGVARERPPGGGMAKDDLIEAVTDRTTFFSRVTSCVTGASSEILAVVGPWAPEVVAALSQARRRSLAYKVVSLGSPAPDGAVQRPVPTAELVAYWGGLPVAVLADRTRAACGTVNGDRCDGVVTTNPGLLPFLRHLLRRELASVIAQRVS